MRKISLLLIMISVLCSALLADISQYYTFAANTGTYTAIAGTTVTGINSDDAISGVIPIGFTFPYGTATYADVKVCSNGWVALGSTQTGTAYTNALTSTSVCPIVAPYWDDLSGDTATVSYLLSGTAPNRVFTVQYANAHHLGGTDILNFQTKLYENGKVEHVYNTGTGMTGATASIGINILPGGATNYWSVSPGTTASASNSTENSAVSTWPGANVIYSFNPPVPVPSDLAAMSIAGNPTPTQGTATNYTIIVRNNGTDPQTNYTVKVMSGTTELASIAGPAIQPGISTSVQVPWTPQNTGPFTIFGKVVLTGDQNAQNDSSTPISVIVQPAGTSVFTIGDGSQTARIPMDFYWKNSLYETVYLQTELNFIGMITGIGLYNDFSAERANMPTKIWLGTTTQTDLTANWIPASSLTQVFDGTVTYPSGQNTVNITFPTPFLYLEGNLVLMVNRPMDTQYYSSMDTFLCQTTGTSRARNIYSDTTTYDPASPPAGSTLSGQFPKTSFYLIPGGVGHLEGTVYGAGNQPLSGVTVQLSNGVQTTTNAVGHYGIQNIVAGDFQVTITRNGYITQTQNVTIPEDETITLNFNMVQMASVTLSGTIVGSDAPTVGLAGALINFTGYENYSAVADASGHFTVPNVYTNQTYEYFATFAGYQGFGSSVDVLMADLDMGNVILSEIAFSPRNVLAVANAGNTAVTVTWSAPDPSTADVAQSFETEAFPPADWSRIITDNTPPDASGVYPTWCRFGEVTVAQDVITPPEGTWQAGFRYSYNHQDEWLITPQFNCPQGAFLNFESNVFLGSANGDHYYVKASIDNGNTWTNLWDASTLTGGWNHYDTPISIDLAQFAGQQIKLAWHGDDPNTSNDGMWYVWFIDNVSVGNATQTLRFPESQMVTRSGSLNAVKTASLPALSASKSDAGISRAMSATAGLRSAASPSRETDRSLVGYKVWRLPQGQEQNQTVWTSLTPETITELTLTDSDFASLTVGTYKWAIKGVYTNNVLSLAIFSNPVVRPAVLTGTMAGLVRNEQNQPIQGAVITVGTLNVTTSSNGSYILQIPEGTHSATCTATNHAPQTVNNIIIHGGQTTAVNFNLVSQEAEENLEVSFTALKGNYPNPFNPETTLSFDIKGITPVRIDIYNTKGQLIRTLVNEVKATGRYRITWDGTDSHGNNVASGIYNYRMQAGSYKATRRMMLLK